MLALLFNIFYHFTFPGFPFILITVNWGTLNSGLFLLLISFDMFSKVMYLQCIHFCMVIFCVYDGHYSSVLLCIRWPANLDFPSVYVEAETFRQSQMCFSIYSLLIEKEICDCQNISVKLPCVCVLLSSRDIFIFSIRVSSFNSYFGVFRTLVLPISTGSVSNVDIRNT